MSIFDFINAAAPAQQNAEPTVNDFVTQPGDPDFTEGPYNSQAMFPAAAAEKRLLENQSRGTKIGMLFEQLGIPLTGELGQIVNKGYVADERTFFERRLQDLDAMGSTIRFGIQDIATGDRSSPDISDYWNVAKGNFDREEQRKRFGFSSSGSDLLKTFGVEEATTGGGKFGRGVAHFAVDVLLDPLTYVTFGASAVGKKALGEVGIKVTNEVAERVGKVIVGDIAESALKKGDLKYLKLAREKAPHLFVAGADGSVAREAVADFTRDIVRRQVADDLISPLIARDWSKLDEDILEQLPAFARGGARISFPFGRGLEYGVTIPGTRGSGRKLVGDPTRKVLERFQSKTNSGAWLSKTLNDVGNSVELDRALLKGVAKGNITGNQFLTLREAFADKHGFEHLSEVSAKMTALRNDIEKISSGDEESLGAMQYIFKALSGEPVGKFMPNNPKVTPELFERVRDFQATTRETLDRMVKLYATFDDSVDPDAVKNWMKLGYADSEFNRALAGSGIAPLPGDKSMGAMVVRKVLDAVGSGGRSEHALGSSSHQFGNDVGVSPIVHVLDKSDSMMLTNPQTFIGDIAKEMNRGVFDAVDRAQIDQPLSAVMLNDLVEPIIDDMVQRAKAAGEVIPESVSGRSGRIFEEDPFIATFSVLKDLNTAITYQRVVQRMEATGLIVTRPTQDQLQQTIQGFVKKMKQSSVRQALIDRAEEMKEKTGYYTPQNIARRQKEAEKLGRSFTESVEGKKRWGWLERDAKIKPGYDKDYVFGSKPVERGTSGYNLRYGEPPDPTRGPWVRGAYIYEDRIGPVYSANKITANHNLQNHIANELDAAGFPTDSMYPDGHAFWWGNDLFSGSSPYNIYLDNIFEGRNGREVELSIMAEGGSRFQTFDTLTDVQKAHIAEFMEHHNVEVLKTATDTEHLGRAITLSEMKASFDPKIKVAVNPDQADDAIRKLSGKAMDEEVDHAVVFKNGKIERFKSMGRSKEAWGDWDNRLSRFKDQANFDPKTDVTGQWKEINGERVLVVHVPDETILNKLQDDLERYVVAQLGGRISVNLRATLGPATRTINVPNPQAAASLLDTYLAKSVGRPKSMKEMFGTVPHDLDKLRELGLSLKDELMTDLKNSISNIEEANLVKQRWEKLYVGSEEGAEALSYLFDSSVPWEMHAHWTNELRATINNLLDSDGLRHDVTDTGLRFSPSEEDNVLFQNAKNLLKNLGMDSKTMEWRAVAVQGRENFVNPELFNVAQRGALKEKQVQRDLAAWFDQAIQNATSIYTPLGIAAMKKQGDQVVKWWKGMATITRPTFHIRNLFGGVFNNMIIGVRSQDYLLVRNNAMKFRKALQTAETFEEALKAVDNPRARLVLEQAFRTGLMDMSFARAEYRGVTDAMRKNALDKVGFINPFDPDNFALVKGGAFMMESLEDFMRMSAFARWLDTSSPEAAVRSAQVAKEMAITAHFDYTHLTRLETKVKQFMPFFVWTRRNLPLQMQMMLEQPGLATRYLHLTQAAQSDRPTEQDNFPGSKYWTGQAVGTGVVLHKDSPWWAQLMFDPQLPITDLLAIDPGDPKEMLDHFSGMLGPHLTLPFNLREQSEFGDVNAPAPLDSIARQLAVLGLFDDKITEEGDFRVPYSVRTIWNTLFPFYSEIVEPVAGPNDPRRQAALGDTPDDKSVLRRIGLQLAKGVGVQVQTPQMSKSAAFEADQLLDEELANAQLTSGITPEEKEEFDKRFRGFVSGRN